MASLKEIISVLLETQVWPAVYVGNLPKGVREVMRKTIESFAITFEDSIDKELLSKICKEMNFTIKERDSYVENIYDQHGNLRGRRTVEWEFAPRVVHEDIIVAHVSPDYSQIYILSFLEKNAVNMAETYRKRKYEATLSNL